MKVCISSSCRFENDWKILNRDLSGLNVSLVFPEVQNLEGLSAEEIDRKMESTVLRFFKEIDDADILFVYCPEGYIGKGVASEIGYSIAKGKEVISSENIMDIGVWSIVNNVMSPDEFKKYLRSR